MAMRTRFDSWAQTILNMAVLAVVGLLVFDCSNQLKNGKLSVSTRSDFVHRCEKAGGIVANQKCLAPEMLIDVPMDK